MSALPTSATVPVRANGDSELERLYADYAGRVHAYCRRQLGGRSEVEDATQTVFLHALRALRRGIVPETESAWLFTIAHNVCRTYWRGAARRRRAEDQHDPQVLEQVVATRETDHDELFGLDDALSRIPAGQRHAILLREWHGLSYREIAETLGTSQGAVEMLLFRARRSLAAELRGERPPARARVLGGIGNVLSSLKLLLGGSSAAKLAAGGVVVAALAAGGTELDHRGVPNATRAVVVDVSGLPEAQSAAQSGSNLPRGSRSSRSPETGVRTEHAVAPGLASPDGGEPGDGATSARPAGTDRPSAPPPLAAASAPRPEAASEANAAPPDAGSPTPSAPTGSHSPKPSPSPVPDLPTLPATPALPPVPDVPPIDAGPELPAVPETPAAPEVPAVPGVPATPTLPVPTPSLP